MTPLTDLTGSTEFVIGLLVGTIGLLIALPAALGLGALFPAKGRRPGLVGPVFSVASVFALKGGLGTDEVASVPQDLVLGLALCWLAGAIASRTQHPWLVGPVASVPGGLLVAGANAGLGHGWVSVLIVVGIAVVGATAADLDRRAARFGLGPLLFFVAVGGIYVTVPDTELMRAVVGVSLPLVLLAWPYAAASLGSGGAYAAVALLLWIAPIEGIGRPGAIVGVVGAFALLIGEPIGREIVPRLERRFRLNRFPIGHPKVTVVGAQVLLTLYASRVAGMVQTALAATVLLIPALAASVAFGVFLVLPEPRRRRHRRKRTSAPGPGSAPTAPGGPAPGGPAGGGGSGGPSRIPPTTAIRRPKPGGPGGSNGSSNGHSNGHGGGDR